ncbi:xanthine dehydrogenase family protein subunit M [Streptomyces albiaxialis]|uniref:Xanthine dehydrogenase family protein subunit M n=1 Tax=Streptomyces albiaxialis TaxID=329523 RepID=A0ABN2WM44_9ACTN
MKEFGYTSVADTEAALAALREQPGTRLLAGGTEMLNWLKEGIERPERLVDITALPLRDVEPLPGGGLRLGALARMSEVAAHPEVVRGHPALAESLLLAASPQLRNMATLGGNLQQRTRCPYFRAETGDLPCNKRTPGSGCAALSSGETEEQALFGWTGECAATHPSDLAVALAALDADVLAEGPRGPRRIPAAAFHLTPEQAPPERHSALASDELITAVEVPGPAPLSHYVKVRQRASYEFALVSAAAVVEVEDGTLATARIALGGVAHRPWRLTAAEEALRGADPEDGDAVYAALAQDFAAARPLPGGSNAYKAELARRTAVRAVRDAARRHGAASGTTPEGSDQ